MINKIGFFTAFVCYCAVNNDFHSDFYTIMGGINFVLMVWHNREEIMTNLGVE